MKSLTIIGRRWFDKRGGNTYHSVKVYVDNKFYNSVDFTYGYDSHYLQTAIELLIKGGILAEGGHYFPLSSICVREDSFMDMFEAFRRAAGPFYRS